MALVCVYTRDFRDREDTRRVRSELRRLGFTRPLSYKPDLYTYWNVYTGNALKVKPTLFTE